MKEPVKRRLRLPRQSGAAPALASREALNFRYHRDVLPSGLRVVTVEAPHLHSAMIACYVRTGSRHETAETNGVSHFLEHLFFRGSQGYPDSVRMNAAVEEAGGNLNGVTTRDHGYYFTPMHPAQLHVGVKILGDMLTRPLLTQLKVEKEIILEEMLDEVDDEGRDIDVDNLSKRLLFGEHPLALKIAGTPDSVRAQSLRTVRDHLQRHYVTGNLIFTAAGNVRRDDVLEQVERAFARLPEGPVTTDVPPPESPMGPWFSFTTHDEAQTELRLNFRTVAEHHPDYPALQLVRRVLDDGLSSRLPFNVVEKRGLAYSLHAGMEPFSDCGLFEIEAACAPDKTVRVFEEISRTLGEVAANGVTAEELSRAKRRHRMFLDFSQDSPSELAGWFGGTEVFRRPETFAEAAALVDQVTSRTVQAVARRYFHRENLGVVAVGQKSGRRALAKAVERARGLP